MELIVNLGEQPADTPGQEAVVTELARRMEYIRRGEVPLCRNAHAGAGYWFCYHWRGEITAGTGALDEHGECAACARSHAVISDESPSFLTPDAEL